MPVFKKFAASLKRLCDRIWPVPVEPPVPPIADDPTDPLPAEWQRRRNHHRRRRHHHNGCGPKRREHIPSELAAWKIEGLARMAKAMKEEEYHEGFSLSLLAYEKVRQDIISWPGTEESYRASNER